MRCASSAGDEPAEVEGRAATDRVQPDGHGVAEDLDGDPMRLADFRGQVVVLVFWGTGCAPCLAQVPQERALVEKYRGRPFALLGVNSDDDRDKLPAALRKHGITWRSWRDGREGRIAGRWGVMAGRPCTSWTLSGRSASRMSAALS
jgi:thiol-disulfide isomerase/thioredoxin